MSTLRVPQYIRRHVACLGPKCSQPPSHPSLRARRERSRSQPRVRAVGKRENIDAITTCGPSLRPAHVTVQPPRGWRRQLTI
jgi:hypothetical protein